MREIYERSTALVAIGAATLAADNTPAAVDLGANTRAMLVLAIGVGGITFSGTNKIEFVLTHSDDNSSYSNVTDAHVIGCAAAISSGIIKALTSAHAAAAVYRFGYVGGKRYLKLLADFSGTHGTGTPIAATVIASGAGFAPTAAQG